MTRPQTLGFLLSLILVPVCSFVLPDPTGPFVTGVRDFEFVDHTYPSQAAEDAQGRRLMFRVWYPICLKSDLQVSADRTLCAGESLSVDLGRRRLYFEQGEWSCLLTAFLGPVDEPTDLTATFHTHSYLNAAVLQSSGTSLPVIIYTHGHGQWVTQNTALLEEIASHGYAVFAVASPGFASGVLYPDGDVAGIYPEFLVPQEDDGHPLVPPWSSDIQTRYNKVENYLNEGFVPSIFPRKRDDLLAMADYLEDMLSSNTEDGRMIRQLIGSDELNGLIYMGFSIGGAAAGSASQHDSRALGAINMDGFQVSMDLFDRAIKVPYLTFSQNIGIPFYMNEFFFEHVETMGQSPNVTRVMMPEGVDHGDFTDLVHLDPSLQEAFFSSISQVNNTYLHQAMVEFCLGFIDKQAGLRKDWTPSQSFEKYDKLKVIDVSYVAAWALESASTATGDFRGLRWALLSVGSLAISFMFFS